MPIFSLVNSLVMSPNCLCGSLINTMDTILLGGLGMVLDILMGVNNNTFEVTSWQNRIYSVSCFATCKKKMVFLVELLQLVYGPTYEDKKDDFIRELFDLHSDWEGPSITGGDFNMVRGPDDKSYGIVCFSWCDKFNGWIDECGLLELHLQGGKVHMG